jgi:hypothetical protein
MVVKGYDNIIAKYLFKGDVQLFAVSSITFSVSLS